MTTTLFGLADPTGLNSYNVTSESFAGGAAYGVYFTANSAATVQAIWFYSPSGATTLPTFATLWDASSQAQLATNASPTWSGAAGSGWVRCPITPVLMTAGHSYVATYGLGVSALKQAYLYGGTTEWFPTTTGDGVLTAPTVMPGGGANGPYVNGVGNSFPTTPAPASLNWLADVEYTTGSGPVPPTITTTSLPAGTVGTAYSASLAATGGTSPYTWSITSGSLPAGLTLASGSITGTPTTAGTSSFTVKVTDAASQTATANLSITVSAGVPGLSVTLTGTSGGISTYSTLSNLNNTGNAGAMPMRVLPPSAPSSFYQHAFLWMLPVEPSNNTVQGSQYGDGIATAQALGVHNQYNLTCIMPGFPIDPWYGNNATDASTQQETFLLSLVTWAKQNLALTGQEKHYLIGFSKSGFGGQVMFWRHQDIFQAVASWDAAMDYQTLAQYDGGPVFGTQAQLNGYTLYDPNLATWKANGDTGVANKIWLGAGINLVAATAAYDARLTADGIQHTYSYVAADSHNWAPNPGWVAPALAGIMPAPIAPPATLDPSALGGTVVSLGSEYGGIVS